MRTMKEVGLSTMQLAFTRSSFKIKKPRKLGWPRGYAGYKRVDVANKVVVQDDLAEVLRRYQGGQDLESRDLDLDSETKAWDACKKENS